MQILPTPFGLRILNVPFKSNNMSEGESTFEARARFANEGRQEGVPKAKKPRARSLFSIFQFIVKKRGYGLSRRQVGLFWKAHKEQFGSTFKSLREKSNKGIEATVEEYLKEGGAQTSNMDAAHAKFLDDDRATTGDRPADALDPGTNVPVVQDGVTVNSATRDHSRLMLRARFDEAGPEDVQETVPQAVSDAVQADLFNKKGPNEDIDSTVNRLWLDNERNQHNVKWMGPLSMPRSTRGPNTQLAPMDPRFEEEQDFLGPLIKRAHRAAAGFDLKRAPPIAVLGDANTYYDPYGHPRKPSYMVPANRQRHTFEPEPHPNQPFTSVNDTNRFEYQDTFSAEIGRAHV